MLVGAAQTGSLDAILGLSDAYESGRLGEKSPALAYQYMLVASDATGNSSFAENANRLATLLTPDEISRAQESARAFVGQCCKSR